jgi:hypothetical protein
MKTSNMMINYQPVIDIRDGLQFNAGCLKKRESQLAIGSGQLPVTGFRFPGP